jgi:hypothetical protein
MRTDILQKWTTVRGSTGITVVTQDEEEWLDLCDCPDAVIWTDCREVSGVVTLAIQSAPTKDDALFGSIVAPTALSALATPTIARTMRGAVSIAPLARWVRWQLLGGSTSNWDATFRIRIGRSRRSFLTPSQVNGCVLWLRSDLALSLVQGGGSVPTGAANVWLDQSGSGNNAASSITGSFTVASGVNGYTAITATGSPLSFFFGNFPAASSGQPHTLFAVASFPYAGNQCAIATTASGSSNFETGASITSNNTPGVSGTISNSSGTTDSAAASTVPSANNLAIYSSAGNQSSVDIYINGTQQGTASVSLTPNTSLSLYYLYAAGVTAGTGARQSLTGPCYEFIAYNRVLLAQERIAVHRYLGARYNIQVP